MATRGDIGIDPRWIATYSKVRLENEIGRGAYGTVYVGLYQDQRVAVKKLYSIILSPQIVERMRREINIMAGLRHPNILTFIAAVFDNPDGDPMIITELMDMSLRKAYENNSLMSVGEKLVILRDVAAGLNYLHCLLEPIIHRDVSSSNVLLISRGSGQWITKVSGFGSANLARDSVTQAPGTMAYSAPEALIATQGMHVQTVKMDVFSFGILVSEILTNQFPHRERFQNLLNMVKTSVPSMYSLIVQCIKEEPEDRPSMKSVLQHIDQGGKYTCNVRMKYSYC